MLQTLNHLVARITTLPHPHSVQLDTVLQVCHKGRLLADGQAGVLEPFLQSCFPAAGLQQALVPEAAPSQVQDSALPHAESHEVLFRPCLQSAEALPGGRIIL